MQVLPETYDIFLHPNISTSEFFGRVKIVCRLVDSTNFIVLHIKDLNISKVREKLSFMAGYQKKKKKKKKKKTCAKFCLSYI